MLASFVRSAASGAHTCKKLQGDTARTIGDRARPHPLGSEERMKRTWLGILLFASAFALPVHADDADFERVFPSVYTDLLFNSKTAYNAARYDEAAPLMKKAACAGDKESQWMLGHMYLLGQGVERDDLAGYSWLKVAAEFNQAEYRKAVDQIEHAIDRKQLPLAEAEAHKYVDAYNLRATHMSCNRSASQGGHIMDRITCTPRYDGQLALIRQCANGPAKP